VTIMLNRAGTAKLLFTILSWVLLLPHTANAQSVAPQIKDLEISPAWAGPHGTTQAVVTIRNDQGLFRRAWNPTTITPKYNSIRIVPYDPDHPPEGLQLPAKSPGLSQDIVSSDDVMALVRALTAPVVSSPSLSNFGIDRAWLTDHANDAAKRFGTLGQPNGERQQEFLRKSFTDLALIERDLPHVVAASWTDDPVWVHVTVRYEGGRTVSAETTNQPAFMLPWTCKANGKTTRTYNADISRAIAKLLPESAVNRDRLQGSGLMGEIVYRLPGAIRQRWEEIGAEDKSGDALARLRVEYTIRRSEVSMLNDLHFGSSPRGAEALEADVRHDSFPENLVVATVFPLEGGKAIGLGKFAGEGNRYERIILDNPWIMASFRKHPDRGAWLIYVKDSSMSDKALRIFAADMHALGRDDLAQEVSAHRLEVAVLSYFYDVLIVFPDHHAIVWRWDTKCNLFEWPDSGIKTARCTDYNTLDQRCSAAVVGPDGMLEH
jgi:hypothetical protein